jgi:phosphomevalonate kinase
MNDREQAAGAPKEGRRLSITEDMPVVDITLKQVDPSSLELPDEPAAEGLPTEPLPIQPHGPAPVLARVRAPGKLMWLGEYAVLDGALAVVQAVDRCVDLTFQPGGEDLGITSNLWDGRWVVQDADGQVLTTPPEPPQRLVCAVFQTLLDATTGSDHLWQNGTLHIDSSELDGGPRLKLGIGSSGAVAAGLTVALCAVLQDRSAERLLQLALRAHATFQGQTGSGADVVASFWGGLCRVGGGRPPGQIVPGFFPPSLVVWTGQEADTRQMVRAWRQWQIQHPSDSQWLVQHWSDVARRGEFALRADDRPGFLDAIQRYADLEVTCTRRSGVPIISTPVAAVLDIFRQRGWVAKPSGAGGGDVVIGFGADPTQTDALLRGFEDAGFEVLPLKTASTGAWAWAAAALRS